MRINVRTDREAYSATLNGVNVGIVMEADTDQGWVYQILTNPYRQQLGMPQVNKEKEMIPVRRWGEVKLTKIKI